MGTQVTVMDFIDQVKHFVQMGGGYGLVPSDRLIDIVICIVSPEEYKWIHIVWVQHRGVG
jgi:hypothetical protein